MPQVFGKKRRLWGMGMLGNIVFFLEIMGTVAFAASGAMIAVNRKMDIFGIAMLGLFTATGGGVLRDLLLGNTPPATFRQPVYALTALVVAGVMFLKPVRSRWNAHGRVFDAVLLAMDSVGLGVFTVVGVEVALAADSNLFTAVFVGVVTGVGGGILRDVMAGQLPFVFVKHFYACASLIGALACALLWPWLGQLGAMLAGAVIVIALRLLAAKFHWKLPRPE